jgi:hypothetical protein
MPTYQPNIPTGTVQLLQDYLNLQANFQQLDIAYGVNHVPFSDTSGVPPGGISGVHKFVQMPNQATPSIQSAQGAIYTKTLNGQSQLVYTSDTGNNDYQLTRSMDASIAKFATATNYDGAHATLKGGWTFLPGGILFQYGILPSPTNGAVITFPVAYSSAANVFSITLGDVRSDTTDKMISIQDGSITATQFQVILSSSSLPTNLYWQAIGK